MQENISQGFEFGTGVFLALILIAGAIAIAVFVAAFLTKSAFDFFEGRARRKAQAKRSEEARLRRVEREANRGRTVATLFTESAGLSEQLPPVIHHHVGPVAITRKNVGAHRG